MIPMAHGTANQNYSRMMRVYRYFRDNAAWVTRERVMHWTGFPSPKDHPVIAYVEFANTLMRLNRVLARSGRRIIGGIETSELYRMEWQP
jgi:hypothetical protein